MTSAVQTVLRSSGQARPSHVRFTKPVRLGYRVFTKPGVSCSSRAGGFHFSQGLIIISRLCMGFENSFLTGLEVGRFVKILYAGFQDEGRGSQSFSRVYVGCGLDLPQLSASQGPKTDLTGVELASCRVLAFSR